MSCSELATVTRRERGDTFPGLAPMAGAKVQVSLLPPSLHHLPSSEPGSQHLRRAGFTARGTDRPSKPHPFTFSHPIPPALGLTSPQGLRPALKELWPVGTRTHALPGFLRPLSLYKQETLRFPAAWKQTTGGNGCERSLRSAPPHACLQELGSPAPPGSGTQDALERMEPKETGGCMGTSLLRWLLYLWGSFLCQEGWLRAFPSVPAAPPPPQPRAL